jgi:D-alanine-D-alanine ligase
MAIRRAASRQRLLSRLTVAVLVDRVVLMPGTSRFRKDMGDAPLVNALRRMVEKVVVGAYTDAERVCKWLKEVRPDVVFNVTENVDGDRQKDGYICALLDLLKLPYTGTGPRGMLLCRDKAVSKLIAAREGFKTPEFFVLSGNAPRLPRQLAFPLVVKPRFDDASVGISQGSLVHTKEALRERIAYLAENLTEDIICEEFIEGREMLVGVIGKRIMPVREFIIGRGAEQQKRAPQILSYRLKHDKVYQRRWSLRTGFAKLTPEQERRVRALTLSTFDALGLLDYGRLDLKLNPSGEWVFLEANPNPGLYPFKGSRYGLWSDIDFQKLIEQIVLRALHREH